MSESLFSYPTKWCAKLPDRISRTLSLLRLHRGVRVQHIWYARTHRAQEPKCCGENSCYCCCILCNMSLSLHCTCGVRTVYVAMNCDASGPFTQMGCTGARNGCVHIGQHLWSAPSICDKTYACPASHGQIQRIWTFKERWVFSFTWVSEAHKYDKICSGVLI